MTKCPFLHKQAFREIRTRKKHFVKNAIPPKEAANGLKCCIIAKKPFFSDKMAGESPPPLD